MALFVGRLQPSVKVEELEALFSPFGKMTRCVVKTGTSLNFGFCEFADRRDAEDALKAHAEKPLMLGGSEIAVEFTKSEGGGGGGRERSSGCFKCGGEGHWAKDCPRLIGGREDGGRRRYPSRSPPRRSRYDSRSPGPYRGSSSRRYDDREDRRGGYPRGDRYDRDRSPPRRRYSRSPPPPARRGRDYSPPPARRGGRDEVDRRRSRTPPPPAARGRSVSPPPAAAAVGGGDRRSPERGADRSPVPRGRSPGSP